MITRLISILFIAFITCFPCNDGKLAIYKKNNVQNFDSCILFIHSPYNCWYKITFNKAGFGSMETFQKEDTSDSFKSDLLINRYLFKVRHTSDMLKINETVEQIKASDTVISPRMFDTYGYEFIIDEKKYIDVYGQNEKIDTLLKILFKYVKNANDSCGFLKLFRQTF